MRSAVFAHIRSRVLIPLVFAAFVAALLPAGCKSNSPSYTASDLPVVQMRIGKQTYNLEVAATEGSRERGLMRRDSMPQDHGMIFVFRDEANVNFWMKDTRIPLFILFLNHNGKVVSTAHMKPYVKEPATPSVEPVQYAIELNDDAEEASGVKVGETLQIPAAALHVAEEN